VLVQGVLLRQKHQQLLIFDHLNLVVFIILEVQEIFLGISLIIQ